VIIGVKNVPKNLKNVLNVQLNPLDLNYHVLVMTDIMMMVSQFVKNVTLSVKLVTKKVVKLVLVIELMLQFVTVQKENILIQKLYNVYHVVINVILVKITQMIVLIVLKTELTNQVVLVKLDSSMMDLMLFVNNVLKDVLLVNLVWNVLPVLQEELVPQIVNVHPELLKFVLLKVLIFVMMDVMMLLALNVISNVKNVTKNLIPVKIVLVIEKKLQNVTVHLVLITLKLLTVHLVPLNVPLVKTKLKTVLNVLKEELMNQNVSVKMDNISMEKSVLIVLSNVKLVPPSKPVLNVPTTPETKPQFVTVKLVSMKMIPLNVQNVLKNVKSVTLTQTTVSLVPETESTHQNVLFQNKLLNPPLLTMLPLVLLNQSLVPTIVLLVKNQVLIV